VQNDSLVLAKELTRGNSEKDGVSDVTSSTGDGDSHWVSGGLLSSLAGTPEGSLGSLDGGFEDFLHGLGKHYL